MQLVEDFSAISEVKSVAGLHAAGQRFIDNFEFERYELQFVTGGLNGSKEHWATAGNVPQGYRPLFEKAEDFRICPVMQHAKRSNHPLYWDQGTYERADKMAKYEAQRPWGYGTGFIVAAHLQRDKHVVVGFEREKPLNDKGRQLTHKFAMFQLFATCAIDACVSLLGKELTPQETECPLTKRERDVLQWTLDGKTAWEVGAILGISQGTAAQHVNNAAKKLGAINKHQAALKALRLGWVK